TRRSSRSSRRAWAGSMTARPAPVVRLSVVESTQTTAFGLAARGAPDGTVVVADHQSAGRGRRGRSWNDAPGTSLLASILVRPRIAPALLATFSIATAVAVAEALRRATGIEARLKWPNDVLARGRKLAGILVETRILTNAGTGVSEPPRTLGRPPTVDADRAAPVTDAATLTVGRPPPVDADHATSVAIETGRVPDRDSVLEAVLQEFDAWRWRLESQGFGQVRERWLALSESIGRRVKVDAVSGLAVGLDVDGALLVDDGRGV